MVSETEPETSLIYLFKIQTLASEVLNILVENYQTDSLQVQIFASKMQEIYMQISCILLPRERVTNSTQSSIISNIELKPEFTSIHDNTQISQISKTQSNLFVGLWAIVLSVGIVGRAAKEQNNNCTYKKFFFIEQCSKKAAVLI